ncbi:MAG: hypothetical protein HY554_10390 [Elusimicrobia bacterium]|nr:hypothetical protein [Elusimicrobiota bacterium]
MTLSALSLLLVLAACATVQGAGNLRKMVAISVCEAPAIALQADHSAVAEGEPVTLSYAASGIAELAESCTLDGAPCPASMAPLAVERSEAVVRSIALPQAGTYRFTLTGKGSCSGSDAGDLRTVSRTVEVTALPEVCETVKVYTNTVPMFRNSYLVTADDFRAGLGVALISSMNAVCWAADPSLVAASDGPDDYHCSTNLTPKIAFGNGAAYNYTNTSLGGYGWCAGKGEAVEWVHCKRCSAQHAS